MSKPLFYNKDIGLERSESPVGASQESSTPGEIQHKTHQRPNGSAQRFVEAGTSEGDLRNPHLNPLGSVAGEFMIGVSGLQNKGGSNCFLLIYDYLWEHGIILSAFHEQEQLESLALID